MKEVENVWKSHRILKEKKEREAEERLVRIEESLRELYDKVSRLERLHIVKYDGTWKVSPIMCSGETNEDQESD